jgi:FixJ family two-component response regulator
MPDFDPTDPTRPSQRPPTVFVVDDDKEFRQSVRLLLASVRIHAEMFASAREFLDVYHPDRPGCLLADVRMPGMSGLELQKWLADRKIDIPVILITAHAEVPMAVEAMKAGAMDFLQKPYSPQQLLERIQLALEQDADRRQQATTSRGVAKRLVTLSPREREVMDLLLEGKNAKEIAYRLVLSTKTVDFHRRNLLEKMGVENVVELSRLVADRSSQP